MSLEAISCPEPYLRLRNSSCGNSPEDIADCIVSGKTRISRGIIAVETYTVDTADGDSYLRVGKLERNFRHAFFIGPEGIIERASSG